MYPRSGFWYHGSVFVLSFQSMGSRNTGFCTLVSVLRSRNIRQNLPFANPRSLPVGDTECVSFSKNHLKTSQEVSEQRRSVVPHTEGHCSELEPTSSSKLQQSLRETYSWEHKNVRRIAKLSVRVFSASLDGVGGSEQKHFNHVCSKGGI